MEAINKITEAITDETKEEVVDKVVELGDKLLKYISPKIAELLTPKELPEILINPDIDGDGKVTPLENNISQLFSQILTNQQVNTSNIQKNANLSNLIMAVFSFLSLLVGLFAFLR